MLRQKQGLLWCHPHPQEWLESTVADPGLSGTRHAPLSLGRALADVNPHLSVEPGLTPPRETLALTRLSCSGGTASSGIMMAPCAKR